MLGRFFYTHTITMPLHCRYQVRAKNGVRRAECAEALLHVRGGEDLAGWISADTHAADVKADCRSGDLQLRQEIIINIYIDLVSFVCVV